MRCHSRGYTRLQPSKIPLIRSTQTSPQPRLHSPAVRRFGAFNATGWIAAALIGVTSLVANPALAKKKPATPERPWPPPKPLKIERFTLDNGMRVVVQPDHSAPLVAVGLMVDVGARDELKGKSGLAHFFEHMMFQGSEKVGKMEHFTALEAVGGQLNANTSTDRTYYYEVVPKGALELALWLEAQRFSSLKIDKANVENQRQTVMEERRQRYGNRPYTLSRLTLRKMAFETWPLAHSTIGSMADLQGAPIDAFEAFWQYWYTPNNVVLALVGDITLDEAKRVAEKHLGTLERRAEPQKAKFAEPEAAAHKYATFAEPLGKMPAFHIAWRVPAKPNLDAYSIEVLAEILDGGDASRLRKKLAKDTGLATRHFAGTYGQRDVDLFHIFAELSQNGTKGLSKAKQLTRETIYEIARDGVSADELRRAKVSFEAGYVFGIESFGERAEAMCRHELYYGDANGFNKELALYRGVTNEDIVRVARKYFTYAREVELDVLPKGLAADPSAAEKPKYVSKAESKLAKAIAKREKAAAKAEKRAEVARQRAEAKAAKAEARKAKSEAKRRAREAAKAAKKAAKEAKKAAKQAQLDAKKAAKPVAPAAEKPAGQPDAPPADEPVTNDAPTEGK